MTPKLTDDQRQAIKEHGDAPVHVLDAHTNEEFVIIRANLYEKVKPLLEEGDLDPREAYPLIDQVMKEDWDDPAMDIYNDYDAHRRKS
jgi:hypothetical protein